MSMIQSGEARAPIALDDPLPPEDDRPTIAGASAIAEVYRRERPRLLRFLAHRGARDDAEDLAQQTFVRVLGKASAPVARILSLEGYLFRVARNLSVDSAKAASRQSRANHVALEETELPAPDMIAALEARDMLNRLELIMRRMKPRTREIFLAHRIDGYTYGEIAARTGLSIKGVEKHMTRAIATIDRNMRHR